MVSNTDAAYMVEAGVGRLLGPPDKAGRIVAGLSGGADSVALAVALRRLGYDVEALHCNYHLRGAESERDELYVRRFCDSMEIPLTICGLDVAAEALRGESLEMTCRRLRYGLFADRALAVGAAAVAVAHHRDDNVETFFLNLMRSAGLAGLKPMLLGCTRGGIERYLSSLGVDYVVDSTNLECDFTRNKVRNRVLPALRRDFPGADEAVAASVGHLREAYGFVEEMMGRIERQYASDGHFDVSSLASDLSSARFVLLMSLSKRGFSAEQVDDILYCAVSGHSGRRFEAGGKEYVLDRGMLRMVREAADGCRFKVAVERRPAAGLVMERSNEVAYFDAEGWDSGAEVKWRPWREGDVICPLGMRGRKKLSDIFNDAKTPADVKASLPLAVKDGEVLWVPGIKRSRRLTLSADTREVVVCRLCRAY